jgi:hypothetical protein
MKKTIIEPVAREKIRLTNKQYSDLIYENAYYEGEYVEGETEWIQFDLVTHRVVGHGRHVANNESVFKRKSDGKYFLAEYQDSVKEMMGWDECQWDTHYEINEVFPKTIETIVYE